MLIILIVLFFFCIVSCRVSCKLVFKFFSYEIMSEGRRKDSMRSCSSNNSAIVSKTELGSRTSEFQANDWGESGEESAQVIQTVVENEQQKEFAHVQQELNSYQRC